MNDLEKAIELAEIWVTIWKEFRQLPLNQPTKRKCLEIISKNLDFAQENLLNEYKLHKSKSK